MAVKEANLGDMAGRKVVRFMEGEDVFSICSAEISDIRYHTPLGEGDKHFIDVYYTDGTSERFLTPRRIKFHIKDEENTQA